MQPSGDSMFRQFSLDWIPGIKRALQARTTENETIVRDTMREALLAFATPIIDYIAEHGTARLFDLADAMQKLFPGATVETLRPIIAFLEASGNLKTIEKDRHGNDKLQFVTK